MTDIHKDKILILDFGSQYTQLIARRVREIGVYSEIFAYDCDPQAIIDFAPKGIILSGGPETTIGDDAPCAPDAVWQLGCPILGICYGLQLLSKHHGGKVEDKHVREFGHADILIHQASALFENINQQQLSVWMSHGDCVTELPTDFELVAETTHGAVAAIQHQSKPIFGVQFHPEVTHTKKGEILLANFALNICQCDAQWTAEHIVHEIIADIRQQVGKEKVLLGLSGGVDSSVVAALLHKAIGDQAVAVFIDNGLLRQNEAEQVMETFSQHLGMKVIHVDAAEQFLTKLKGISDPEQKRKIIGNTFVEVFEEQAKHLQGVEWLAQGTIYPDVIESAGSKTGKAKVIKTHHNVGGLPERLNFKLLEPLRELFKDEVRKIGEQLDLPHKLLYRHPFPGPGLGVRILGEVKKDYADILRKADAIFMQLLEKYDYYHKVNQAFAVFLPVKSVGVLGDNRHYDYVVALRAVETIDFMTARWAQLPYELLAEASTRIINEVSNISRVTYDISSKPPATIEWE